MNLSIVLRVRLAPVVAFTCLLLSLTTPWVQASVVIQGTRVIYPAKSNGKNVQLTNTDDFPNVVQAWMDIDNPQSDPDTADAPFLVTPPLFRMEPRAGQSIRLVYMGEPLPVDRESLFYLNVLQIPPKNPRQAEQNQMLLMLRSRLKVFYRPAGIDGYSTRAAQQLVFSLSREGDDWVLSAQNPTGYYVTLSSATVQAGGQRQVFKTDMVAPFSSANWRLRNPRALPSGRVRVDFVSVDDYGSRVPGHFEIGG